MKRQVAILVYEGAEVLDFAGPFEVFAVTSELNDDSLFDVSIVGASRDPVRAVTGMLVVPNRSFDELARPDVLVVPGGSGSRQAMHDPSLLQWTARAADAADIAVSVCSGARIFGALGLLAAREVTTRH
jgi:transcriptional regulator GlxA family with amidase domain